MRTKALLIALAVTLVCAAKDIKTVVLNTAPEMHCSSCENKIKSNIRFEKGVKDIETNLADKTVTVTYDADKTNVEQIIEGFKKIDYVATVATPKAEGAPQAEQKKGGCCGSGGCKCGQKKAEAKAEAKTEAKSEEKKGCSCCSKKKE
jgi:copper chaperone CopZ